MACTISKSRLARSQAPGVVLPAGLTFLGIFAGTGGPSVAQDLLTNDSVVKTRGQIKLVEVFDFGVD